MKRKFFLATIVVGLVVIIGGLSSCKKEEPAVVNKKLNATAVVDKFFDYDKYIDDLSKETGIDIRKLSKDEVIIPWYQYLNKFAHDLDINVNPDQKGNFSEEDSILFMQIYDQMLEAVQNSDMETFNILYDQLLYMLYGNNIPIYMRVDNVHEYAMQNVANLQRIENSYPQLGELPQVKKEEVLSAAFYLITSNTKNLSGSECIEAYNNARRDATLHFGFAMGLCVLSSAGGPWVTAACVAYAGFCLGTALHAAEVALNNCH